MKLIGLELYQHLLGLALRQARGEDVEDWSPELNLGAAGELPADYIPEPDLRLNLYARLARVTEPHAAEQLAEEVEDRFGPPPPPARDLLALAKLRAQARALGVARIDAGPLAIALTFRHRASQAAHAAHVDAASALKWSGERLVLAAASETAEQRLELAAALLDDLA
jgi:transcription-repair coupling factor (superfamily II helicase)